MAGIQLGRRSQIASGPPKGVVNSRDPFDDDPGTLQDARNGYIPAPDGGSGWYARPGFSLLNGGAAIYGSASAIRFQGGYAHTALDGTTYNFLVIGGHLFRIDETLTTFTDVTPVGVTIDSGTTSRVKFVSLAGELVVSDGVHRPWIASNLANTPITGTYIDFDGVGTEWSAQDITVYSGAIVVLLNVLDGVYAQTDIAWSAPGDPATGYQQPTYDYRWTLEQTGSQPIFAIHGTNIGLYYFRQLSIGLATGVLGPDFQTAHTDDAVANNLGTQSPQTVIGFSDRLFFTDQIGRPQMLPLGGHPVPIWQQLRADVTDASTAYQAVTARVSTAAYEPTLNLYLVGIWSPTPSIQAPVTQWFAFDAATGRYVGRWNVTSADRGNTAVDLLCSAIDNTGRVTLLACGSKDTAPATTGYVWSFNALLGTPDQLATEDGDFLTTEDGVRLTTEGQEEVWMDNGVVPVISVTTVRLGYSADVLWNVDQATIITGSAAPVAVTMVASATPSTVEGTPTPAASNDGTYRCVVGANVLGRGTQVTVSPTTAETQWSYQRSVLTGVASLAGPEDA